MLTTAYSGNETCQRIRKKPTSTTARSRPVKLFFGDDQVKLVTVPSVTAHYNDLMGAVDIGDQLREGLRLNHRFCKGSWRALAWTFLLGTCLTNSYLLQYRAGILCNWKPFVAQNAWRTQLVIELLAAYGQDGSSRQRLRPGDIFVPILQHKHVQLTKGSRCIPCQGWRAGQTRSRRPLGVLQNINTRVFKKTRYGCATCKVSICTDGNCWDIYHSSICL